MCVGIRSLVYGIRKLWKQYTTGLFWEQSINVAGVRFPEIVLKFFTPDTIFDDKWFCPDNLTNVYLYTTIHVYLYCLHIYIHISSKHCQHRVIVTHIVREVVISSLWVLCSFVWHVLWIQAHDLTYTSRVHSRWSPPPLRQTHAPAHKDTDFINIL